MKETWEIGTNRDKMEKLIKYYMHVPWRKGALVVNLEQFKHKNPINGTQISAFWNKKMSKKYSKGELLHVVTAHNRSL